jgi:hypothetical protein
VASIVVVLVVVIGKTDDLAFNISIVAPPLARLPAAPHRSGCATIPAVGATFQIHVLPSRAKNTASALQTGAMYWQY